MNQFKSLKSDKKVYELPVEDMYPEMSAEDQKKVAFFLDRYLKIVLRIYEKMAERKGRNARNLTK